MKRIVVSLMAVALCLSCLMLAACQKGSEEAMVTVTYYDADASTVLKTEEVPEGGKATAWTPQDKQDAKFLGWYATPNYAFAFDFETAVTKDTPVYSMWSSNEKDERTWMIAGEFQGKGLKDNNWGEDGRLSPEKYAFDAVEGKTNAFTLTVDLYEGDVFQFGVFSYEQKEGGGYERVWVSQKGFGLLTDPKDNFTDEGNYLASDVNKHDIGVAVSGTYRFDMTTDVKNDNVGKIEWERLSDAPALQAEFTPSVFGTFNGYICGASIDAGYMMRKTDPEGYAWEAEVSMSRGDLFMVLPFNNYRVQLNNQFLAEGSEYAVGAPAGQEIMFTETAKYSVKLDITEKGEEFEYSVSVEKIGAYEVKAGEDRYTVEYRSAQEGTNYDIYLKNGARFPIFADPVLKADEDLMGWHLIGAGESGENVGIANESTYAADGSNQNGRIGYGVTTAAERDTRRYWIKGTGGTANGETLDWGGKVYLEQTGDHQYTATLVLDGEQKNMQICEDYLGVKTGTYLRNGHIVDYKELPFIEASNAANISFKENGTYTLTLDSMTSRITVVKTA